MPFAKKFRAMLDFPFPGDRVGDFVVESVDVRDVPHGSGPYTYAARMVVRGPGGQQGVRRAFKSPFDAHPWTFSGYGNPYQLWCGRPAIESLGDKRYAVRVEGGGSRIYVEDEFRRFVTYLAGEGALADDPDPAALAALVDVYLDAYRAEIRRKVSRYQRQLRQIERNRDPSHSTNNQGDER
jgi:hypothetical protein